VLAVRDVAHDRDAVAGGGPEVLGAPPLVAGDDGVGRGEDGLRRTVVLLEEDRPGVGVVLLELDDVADRRAAERVDGLVGVADDAQLAGGHGVSGRALGQRGPDQLLDQLVLRDVGVLVLVDEDVPEPAPVVLGRVGERLQEVHRRHDEVVEVHRVGLPQAALVCRVGLRDALVVVAAGRRRRGIRLLVDEVVLEVAHGMGEGPWLVALRIEVEVA